MKEREEEVTAVKKNEYDKNIYYSNNIIITKIIVRIKSIIIFKKKK